MKTCQICGEKSIVDTEHFCHECKQELERLKNNVPAGMCKVCGLDPEIDDQGLCADCTRLKELGKRISPERLEVIIQAAYQMADDMIDEHFGPEPGTVLH